MISFLVIFSIFFIVAFVAFFAQEGPVERLSAVVPQSLPERPTSFFNSSSNEIPLHYSGPVFKDNYEEWHYYRHHLHPDEYLDELRQRFMDEYNQGIFGLWDALRKGDTLTPDQEDLAELLQLEIDQTVRPDVIDGTWN